MTMNTNTYVIEARKGLTKRNRPTFYRNLRKYERGIRLVTTRTAPTAKNYIGRIEAEETCAQLTTMFPGIDFTVSPIEA